MVKEIVFSKKDFTDKVFIVDVINLLGDQLTVDEMLSVMKSNNVWTISTVVDSIILASWVMIRRGKE